MFILPLLAVLAMPVTQGQTEPPEMRIVEIVADPLSDWNEDGKLTGSDEYVEIENTGSTPVDLTGWRLLLNDTSPTQAELTGSLSGGERRLVQNPPGELNQNGHVALLAPNGSIVDEVRFGSWSGSVLPSADARNQTDEALSLVDGAWRRWHATPGFETQAPRWLVSTSWTPPPADGWWSPSSTGTLSARPIHAGLVVDQIVLERRHTNGTMQIGSVSPGTSIITSASNGEFIWRIPDTAWNASAGAVRLDAVAPHVVVPESEIWIGPNRSWTPTLVDHESGAAEFQWRTSSTNESEWSESHDFRLPSNSTTHIIQVRSRDRVGNIGPWTNATVGFDPNPPSPPVFLVQGLRVSWMATDVSGAPIVSWNLTRTHGTSQQAWDAKAAETSIVEAEASLGRLPLAYEIRARDAAGNLGEAGHLVVDHPGLHPIVTGIRITKPSWGPGTQELRIDFDRRMDTSTAAMVDVAGKMLEEGRWFANATTYYGSLTSADDWPEGPVSVRILQATASDGAALRGTKSAVFHIDRSDPTFDTSPPEGWTNLGNVTVNVTDASSVSATWKLFRTGQREPDPWNETFSTLATVPMPASGEWTVKVAAKDAAGNSATRRFEFRIDRTTPNWTPAETWPSGTQVLTVSDGQSGLDSGGFAAELPPGWTWRQDARSRILIEPSLNASTGTGWIESRDRASNAARHHLTLTIPSSGAAPTDNSVVGEDDASTRLAANLGDERTVATTMAQEEGGWHGAWWTAGLVASSALSIPLVKRARRRRKQLPSFARLILAARGSA